MPRNFVPKGPRERNLKSTNQISETYAQNNHFVSQYEFNQSDQSVINPRPIRIAYPAQGRLMGNGRKHKILRQG